MCEIRNGTGRPNVGVVRAGSQRPLATASNAEPSRVRSWRDRVNQAVWREQHRRKGGRRKLGFANCGLAILRIPQAPRMPLAAELKVHRWRWSPAIPEEQPALTRWRSGAGRQPRCHRIRQHPAVEGDGREDIRPDLRQAPRMVRFRTPLSSHQQGRPNSALRRLHYQVTPGHPRNRFQAAR